ncbi:MAG TPA: ABC transporter permease [Chloroflexota bacterium]
MSSRRPSRERGERRRSAATAAPLLGPAVVWIAVFYLVPLTLLLIQSFWTYDPVNVVTNQSFTLGRYGDIAADPVYRDVLWKTVKLAALVTITDIALAFPLAAFIAYRIKRKSLGLLLVIIPLWSSYLVRAYAWRTILGHDGVLNSFLIWAHVLSRPSDAFLFSNTAMYITFTHVWLPFMVLPLYTALEKIPPALLEASRDLGANGPRTFAHVVLPLVLPGIIAGSIATFSLTMGDYITPSLLGGPDSNLIGNLIFSQFGETLNWPLGSALSMLVLAVLACFLILAGRTGALEAM